MELHYKLRKIRTQLMGPARLGGAVTEIEDTPCLPGAHVESNYNTPTQ